MAPRALLLLAALAAVSRADYLTQMQLKCAALNGAVKTAFVGSSCFIATREKYNVSMEEWPTLHKRCDHLNGYRGRMAHIKQRSELADLLAQQVIDNKDRYYVAAKQDPIDTDQCGGAICDYEVHSKNWFFFDESGAKIAPLNTDLWLLGEPNNMGENPPEHAVTLERFDSYQLGFNDANPEMQTFKVLCQYDDYIECKDGYVLVRDMCYKVYPEKKNAADASAKCAADGGKLAAIHDDDLNTLFTVIARKNGEITRPFRTGLKLSNDKWSNEDGSPADYFRWHDNVGCPGGEKAAKDGLHALLIAEPTEQNASPGYWISGPDSELTPFICQRDAAFAY